MTLWGEGVLGCDVSIDHKFRHTQEGAWHTSHAGKLVYISFIDKYSLDCLDGRGQFRTMPIRSIESTQSVMLSGGGGQNLNVMICKSNLEVPPGHVFLDFNVRIYWVIASFA